MTFGAMLESVALLDGAGEALAHMLESIRYARRTVHLEASRLPGGRMKEELRAALSLACRRGVRVTVVHDGPGTSGDHTAPAALRGDWCRVRTSHALAGLRLPRRRNRRLVVIADGEVAFLGEEDVFDGHGSGEAPPGSRPDRCRGASALALEVRGPAAACLERRLRGSPSRSLRGRVSIWLPELYGCRSLRGRAHGALGAARREIVAAYSPAALDWRSARSLAAAAGRGVRVTALLSQQVDAPLARAATLHLYRKLLAAGVEVREWTRSVDRANVSVVDGKRLLVGRFGADPLAGGGLDSLVEVDDPLAAAAGRSWLTARLEISRPVGAGDLATRGALRPSVPETVMLAFARSAQWIGQLRPRP